MTNKGKLATWDKLKAEHDKLSLALYDLTCNTKFPFANRVTVSAAEELDEAYRCIVRVSVSARAMPVYMVEFMDVDGDARTVANVQFWTEGQLDDNRGSGDTFFRVMQHARWKMTLQTRREVA